MSDTQPLPTLPHPPLKPADRVVRKKDGMRSAWISFAGRILAQLIGAAATVGLGVIVLHKGAAPSTTTSADKAAASTSAAFVEARVRKPGPVVIAVLPLDDYSEPAAADHFVDSVTDELITDLSQSVSLRVISRTTAMHYKARQLPIAVVGRELGVDFVVEGSTTRIGDRVRVTAQLIDARSDEHVWAKSYDRSSSDLLSVQSELASVIAREIDAQLSAPSSKLTAN